MLLPFTKAFRAAVLEVAAAHVGQKVYADLAPKGAELPYIVISVANGATPNRISVVEGRVTFNVQVIVDGNAQGDAKASQIYDAIFDHLRDKVLTLDAPWSFYDLNHLTTYRRVEVMDNQRLAYAGGLFLLEADKV